MKFLEDIFSRRRFGMKPGLEAISSLAKALGDPQLEFPSIHIAGTNGKGAIAAILDAALRSLGLKIARYTSPHLVSINERFFIDGSPAGDDALEEIARRVVAKAQGVEVTFFEALTAIAFSLFAKEKVDFAILETGLGGRLDATNICRTKLSIITRIGLDHCDWLGDTIEAIAKEKSGIIKEGVSVVLGANRPEVVDIVKETAAKLSAPFFYAPDIVQERMVPRDFSLPGSFNRENAVTAIAALKVLKDSGLLPRKAASSSAYSSRVPGLAAFSRVVWPGRFHRIGDFIIDGAHNPPAAEALAGALCEAGEKNLVMIAGFCADKDIDSTLEILKPFAAKVFTVKTNNPRSLEAKDLARRFQSIGIEAQACQNLDEAIAKARAAKLQRKILVCGSLFLAGEALVALGGYPWANKRFDLSEAIKKEES